MDELRPDIPPRLSAIVTKMMAKHPDNRLQNAAEVIRYLTPLAERHETTFNFRSVLASRMVYAKKRLAQQKEKASGKQEALEAAIPQPTPVVPPPAEPATPRQSTIETIVREETRLDQSRRGANPPDSPDS